MVAPSTSKAGGVRGGGLKPPTTTKGAPREPTPAEERERDDYSPGPSQKDKESDLAKLIASFKQAGSKNAVKLRQNAEKEVTDLAAKGQATYDAYSAEALKELDEMIKAAQAAQAQLAAEMSPTGSARAQYKVIEEEKIARVEMFAELDAIFASSLQDAMRVGRRQDDLATQESRPLSDKKLHKKVHKQIKLDLADELQMFTEYTQAEALMSKNIKSAIVSWT